MTSARWPRPLFIAAGMAITVGVAGCGSGSTSSSGTTAGSGAAAAGANGTIALEVPGVNEFTECLATGFIRAANNNGYNVKLTQAGFSDQGVLNNFQQLISQQVKGIVVLPTSDQSAAQGTLLAQTAGIPVSNAGWFGETSADGVFVGRLRLDVGLGAQYFAQQIKNANTPGEVVFISGIPGLPTSDAFEKALGPAIDQLGGGWKLVGVQPGFYVRDKAITAAQNLLTAHPNAKTIVALSADEADGVQTYLKQTNKSGITLISGDSDLALVNNLKSGAIKSDLFWGAADQGQIAANLLIDYLKKGTKSTDVTPIPISIETGQTIDARVQAHPICYSQYFDQAKNMS